MAMTSRQLTSWLAVSATPPQWSTALAAARLAARRRGAAKRTARRRRKRSAVTARKTCDK